MKLNDIPKEFFTTVIHVLEDVCGKNTWFVAGGFVRDYLLDKPQADLDIFIGPVDGLTLSLLLNVLNSRTSSTKSSHWYVKFDTDYLYNDMDHGKHISYILEHKKYKIQLIVLDYYIDGSTLAIDNYVRNYFDCTLSMCWWAPSVGLTAVLGNSDDDLSFIDDSKNQILRFKKTTSQAYKKKLISKYSDYKLAVTPYE